ncbi:MAG: hypothetical protein Q4F43_00870 [Eubacteriales bacterium]|nr:hypothetical protein [Eubacteriales bacterium]
MKCLVCGNEFDGASADRCPRCAYPIIGITEETEETRQWAREQAEEYTRQLLDQCSISLTVYAYASYADGTMHFREEREFLLAGGENLRKNRIFWNDQEFSRNRDLNLDVVFRRRNGLNILEKHLKLHIAPPAAPSPWKAGVRINPDLTAAVVVGNVNSYSRSETFDLLQ